MMPGMYGPGGVPGPRRGPAVDPRMQELARRKEEIVEKAREVMMWKMLLEAKGGALLTATFQEQGETPAAGQRAGMGYPPGLEMPMRGPMGGRRPGATGGGKTLELTMVVAGEDAKRLDDYVKRKEKQYPDDPDDWPIKISGKLTSLEYDGAAVHATLHGEWKSAPGGGIAGRQGIRRDPRRDRDRRSPRERNRTDRRRGNNRRRSR